MICGRWHVLGTCQNPGFAGGGSLAGGEAQTYHARMGRNRRWWRARGAALAVLALALAGCVQNAPLDSLDPKGPFAERINGLFWPVFWVAVVIFVLVEGAILVAAVVFRDRPGRAEPKQTHGSPRLEVVWTVIPALILAGIAVPTVSAVFDLTKCGSGAMSIEVIAHQWWFEYRYPEEGGVVTANVLVIPAGQEVCLSMTSEDVLHNFWVPNLNGKRYLIPGQTTTLRLQADEPGEFWGHCAEFCGLSHSLMRARVEAVPTAEFDAWIDAQRQPAPVPAEGTAAAVGLAVFEARACTQCHFISGTNDVANPFGPNLTHFASRHVFAGATLPEQDEDRRDALKRWIANPPEVKPGSFMPDLGLTEQEIEDVIAYLETLQ